MSSLSETVRHPASAEDLAALRALFAEYAASLPIKLDYQGFAAELAGLPAAYAMPRGRLWLALVNGQPAGCVALRPFDDRACEMKRLFVRPAHQGRGLGRRLAEQVITDARAIGYSSMLLDTLDTMEGALRLYDSLGFVRRDPYYSTPIGNTVFMELKL